MLSKMFDGYFLKSIFSQQLHILIRKLDGHNISTKIQLTYYSGDHYNELGRTDTARI